MNPTEIQHAVGEIGTISTTVTDSLIQFETDHIAFDMLHELAFGIRNAANALTLSKSGKTETLSPSDDAIAIANTWSKQDAELTTSLSLSDTGVTLQQSASVSEGGIAGTTFTLRISHDYNVILPIQNGVRLSKEHPQVYGGRMGSRFEYGGNNAIQMQMLILEGENGGVVIYAEDAFTQYKAFDVKHSGTSFTITVETIPQAPFTNYTAFDSVPWKIIPYEGSWTSGSAIYRDFARKAFGSEAADARRPDWVDDIAIVVQADLRDTKKLNTIAQAIDPSKVLLQVSNFRTNLYDVNWPDYTVAPDFKEYIDYAHKLGFKVQLHVNMNGCQMELPVYQEVKAYHMVNAINGKKHNEDFTDANGNSFKFAHINPASSEWRKIVIGNLVKAVEETGADSLHLDQSLLAYNDANGLVDGMTSLQGNVLYHKELLEALPDGVVLGGEGINDFNAIHATFLQSHLYGIDTTNKKINAEESAQIVPVTASVMIDVITYQHPAVPTVATGDYYLAWYLNGTAIGHIPTLYRESSGSIAGNSAIMQMVLKEAEWYIQNKPIRVYSDWDKNTIARWQLQDGTFARAVKTDEGYVLYTNEEDKSSVLSQIVYGTDKAKVYGSLPGCYVYDDEYYYALDPNRYYVVTDQEKIAGETHITAITPQVVVEQITMGEGYLQLAFSSEEESLKTVSLTLYCREEIEHILSRSGQATCEPAEKANRYDITLPMGETIYLIYKDGMAATLPLSFYSQKPLTYYVDSADHYTATDTTAMSTGSFAGQLRKKITVKVPSQTMTALDYIVVLPDKPKITLDLLVGSATPLSSALPICIQINNQTVWEGSIEEANVAQTLSLPLDDYKGQGVLISLQADGRNVSGTTKDILWLNPVLSAS